jgi:hypothetical protein
MLSGRQPAVKVNAELQSCVSCSTLDDEMTVTVHLIHAANSIPLRRMCKSYATQSGWDKKAKINDIFGIQLFMSWRKVWRDRRPLRLFGVRP